MSVKFSYQYSHSMGLDCFKNFTDPCQGGPGWTNAHLFAINDTHTFSPSLLLNVTLGFTRGVWHIDAYNPHGVSDPLGTLGFPSYLQSNGFAGVPAIFIDQYASAGYANIGTDPYGNYRLGQDTGQLSATLDKVHGTHRSSSDLTAESTRLITSRPTPPMASSPSMPTVPMPARRDSTPAAAIPWPVS